ncbi:MAG: ATP-binding protein [Planctomycetota bacterium]
MATTFRLDSLTHRITCVVALMLTLAGALFGWTFYSTLRHSIHEELKSVLNQRITWLRSSLELDDEGKLEFEFKGIRTKIPQNWRVATSDGRVLWSLPDSQVWSDDTSFLSVTKLIDVGEANGQTIAPSDIKTLSPATATQFASYTTGSKRGSLTLHVSVREPAAHSEKELSRIALALWTLGPVSILCLVMLLSFFIRKQLAPLGVMSREAARIGPGNTTARISDAGTSSELLGLRESLNSMVKRLAEGMERERQFASMAAHELRTPLTQMRLNAEVTLSRERVAADYRDALLQSLDDMDRLQNLVVNLLFLTRDHSGPGIKQHVALQSVIDHAIKNCGLNAVVGSVCHEGVVLGNDELLTCAVRNVLENAMRYAPGCPAEIIVNAKSDVLNVTVQDEGPGISTEHCERIFDPLVRLNEARTIGAVHDGFGLGLTVARNAVRACGGELVCRTRSDGKQGAAFVFTFIRAPQASS